MALTRMTTFLILLWVYCSYAVAANQPLPTGPSFIKITSPRNEETFHHDANVLTVSVTVTPALRQEDKVVIFLDGEPTADLMNLASMTIPRLDRGSHTLQAKLIKQNGQEIESEVVTIFQQRHSILLGPGPLPKTETNRMTIYSPLIQN